MGTSSTRAFDERVVDGRASSTARGRNLVSADSIASDLVAALVELEANSTFRFVAAVVQLLQ